MSNKWKISFWIFIIVNLVVLVVLPLFFIIPEVKLFVKQWLSSFGSYRLQVIGVLGIIDGTIITTLGVFYNSEHKENKELEGRIRQEDSTIKAELSDNISILEAIIQYMLTNSIKSIYFYPDDNYEWWELEDGSSKKVDCNNNSGILYKRLLFSECKDLECVVSHPQLKEMYSFIREFNESNGFMFKGVQTIKESKFVPLEGIESFH
ncbi:MAG: hypothetical protein CVU95_12785 [Firmicutes bacterium HGW-Firmicutes-2]|jgi:hypothetical protein|nr:MAG: hypothetical protein CVU95_12785 [Firmicutes bacterium HGW-Firmicutes-2]